MGERIAAAASQAWPAFVLVSGLLLVGIVAHADGLFVLAGRQLERMPGRPVALLLCGMALVAVVTALLNLDTAVVFLTPVLVHAARTRGVSEKPFLYSAVFMANASSLYLPGSNLTNLLVLAHSPISGSTFAARLIAPALAATLATALGLVLLFRKFFRERSPALRGDRTRVRLPLVGTVATLAAACLTVALRNAAVPVLAVGALAAGTQVLRGRVSLRDVLRAVGPLVLVALFATAVAFGTLARSWGGPASILASATAFETAAIGALAAVLVNNLPAAVLLSSGAAHHSAALLIGLNLGPNIAVSGSLSALLWYRAASAIDARPSILTYSLDGAVLAAAAMFAALGAASAVGSPL